MKLKMYLNILMLLLLGTSSFADQKPGNATVVISIPDMKDSTAQVEIVIRQYDNLNERGRHMNLIMKNGRFQHNLLLDRPTRVVLKVNSKILFALPIYDILIEPGDSIHVHIANFDKTNLLDVDFSGVGAEKLRFLQRIWTPYMKSGSKKKPFHSTPFDEYIKDQLRYTRLTDSALFANKAMISDHIFKIVRAQTLNLIFDMTLDLIANKIGTDSIDNYYQDFLAQHSDLKKVLADSTVFWYLSYPHRTVRNLALSDYAYRNKVDVKNVATHNLPLYYTIISEYYKKDIEVKNSLLAERIVAELRLNGNSAVTSEIMRKFLSECPYATLRNEVSIAYDNSKKADIGKPFYNFELKNNEDKLVKLSDFRGKFVFIDFNFNGCGACAQLVPLLSRIEEKYKEKNVVFVSISIDKTIKEWKKGQGIYSTPTSLQLYTNGMGSQHPLITEMAISAYPTLFLVGKDGKILSGKIGRSFDEISTQLDKFLIQ